MQGPIIACPRKKVREVIKKLPASFLITLEQSQQIAHCCRQAEEHEIEAFKSKADAPEPDIYILYCSCGKKHRRFMIGEKTFKPTW